MNNSKLAITAALLASLGLTACGGSSNDDDEDTGTQLPVPGTYSFDSRFGSGSSVAYPGQVARNVLIDDLDAEIEGLDNSAIAGGEVVGDNRDDIIARFNQYYLDGPEGGTTTLQDVLIKLTTDPQTVQTTYGSISTGKDLEGKIAGNDEVTDHADWDGGDFVGWGDPATTSPNTLIQDWIGMLADNIIARRDQGQRFDFDGNPIEPWHTMDGLALNQLIEKFLLMAVAYSQATDDYLDDDPNTPGKGLLADNAVADGSNPYSPLEHQWDEGFGYFGAARDYNDYTDSEIANDVYRDSNGDSAIDLESEFNFPLAGYAAKRDLGSTTNTTFSEDIFQAFLTGRTIITEADGALTNEELDALREQRDIVVENWEKVIAANVVHYINETIADMDAYSDPQEEYSYAGHTAHWSEMKAFALGLQFNPRMAMTDQQFADFHDLVGTRPVLPNAASGDVDAYRTALLEARAIIRDAYAFATEDVENW